MAGDGQVGPHDDAARPVGFGSGRLRERPREGRRLDAGRPQHTAGLKLGRGAGVITDGQPPEVDVGDDRPHVHFHAQLAQGLLGLAGQLLAEGGKRGTAAVEQQNPRLLWFGHAVLGPQRLGRELPDLASQLNAGRARPDECEGEPVAAFGRIVGGLGHLERADDPAADGERVGDRLHARCELRELIVPEVGLPHPGGHDEVVVREFDPAAPGPDRGHTLGVNIDAGRLGHDALDVLVSFEHAAQRRGDLPLGQNTGRALVEQRLEQVLLGPVDEGHRHVAPERPGGEQPAEAAADDDDAARAARTCRVLA